MTDTSVRVTKERILDAAERLFCDLGIDATSLRQITSSAEVNLAAVNYHFQSKDELVRAVYCRRLQPVNEERVAMLTALEKQYGKKPVPLDLLLEAFYAPMVNGAARLSGAGATMAKMMGRMFSDPHPVVDRILTEEVAPVAAKFNRAFGQALPHLTKKELFWRMYLSFGVLAHALANAHKLTLISGGVCQADDLREVLIQTKAFAKAGLSAASKGSK